MGITRRRTGRIIGLQGAFIGASGLVLGLGSGLSFILVQEKWGLIRLPEAIYFVESLPVKMPPGDILLVVIVGLFLIGLALFYPARVAGKLLPREAIQFEK
jgi:lipoprotein-releasing system permease protein